MNKIVREQGTKEFPQRPRSGLLIVLITLMGVGPLFPFALASSGALVVERLEVSVGQLGTLASVIFFSAALSSKILGQVADKISVHGQLIFNFGGTFLAFCVAATTSHFNWMILAATLAGASQAISNPTTNRIILELVPKANRPSWIGIKQSGVQIAQLFSGLFFPTIALYLGWVGAAFSGALLAIFAIIYGLWILRQYYPGDPCRSLRKEQTRQTSELRQQQERLIYENETPSRLSLSGAQLQGSAELRLLLLLVFLFGFGGQAVNVYLPLFAVEELNFTLVQGGLTVTVYGTIGIISRIWWARRVSAGGRPSTLLGIMAAGSTVTICLLIFAQNTQLSVLVWVAAILHGMTALGANVVINTAVMTLTSVNDIGRISGLNSMGMYTGFTLGPLVVGLLHTYAGEFTPGFVTAGLTFLLGAGIAVGWAHHRKNKK